MLNLLKKKPKIKPIIIFIPAEHVLEFHRLRDLYGGMPVGQDQVAKYNLWKFITDVTGVKIGSMTWTIGGGILNPYIEVNKFS